MLQSDRIARLTILVLVLLLVLPRAQAFDIDCKRELETLLSQGRGALLQYEAIRAMGLRPTKSFDQFCPSVGVFVKARHPDGTLDVLFRVLARNPGMQLGVIGAFNNWDHNQTVWLKPENQVYPGGDPNYFVGVVNGFRHQMQYRLTMGAKEVLDMGSLVFSSPDLNELMGRGREPYLNSVFWDIEGAGRYQHRAEVPDLRGKPVLISEVEIFTMAQKWVSNGHKGPPSVNQTYRFIAESGVIDWIKDRGFNAVEVMPITQSLDPQEWVWRYQTYGYFAPDSRGGTPQDFAAMIDAFNRAGIVVIMDAVIGHVVKQGNVGVRELSEMGPSAWKTSNGLGLFGGHLTEWQTLRLPFKDPLIDRFLRDSILNFMKYYHIGGVRIDNAQGIMYEGGRDFLTHLAEDIRSYRPEAILLPEAFGGTNFLIHGLDRGGVGANSMNHHQFYDFLKNFAQKRTEEINLDALEAALNNPFEWSEAILESYDTNHDEAANGRGDFTGQYPVSALSGGGDYFAFRKAKLFNVLPVLTSSFSLTMLQSVIGQRGSFGNNTPVDFDELGNAENRGLLDFASDVRRYVREQIAFAPQNLCEPIVNHKDNSEHNKVLSVVRTDHVTGRHIVVVFNFSHNSFNNYNFGLDTQGSYRLAIDSDSNRYYQGSNELSKRLGGNSVHTNDYGMHGKQHSITIPYLAPYSVTIFEQQI